MNPNGELMNHGHKTGNIRGEGEYKVITYDNKKLLLLKGSKWPKEILVKSDKR